jgi:hypothetical protein
VIAGVLASASQLRPQLRAEAEPVVANADGGYMHHARVCEMPDDTSKEGLWEIQKTVIPAFPGSRRPLLEPM